MMHKRIVLPLWGMGAVEVPLERHCLSTARTSQWEHDAQTYRASIVGHGYATFGTSAHYR